MLDTILILIFFILTFYYVSFLSKIYLGLKKLKKQKLNRNINEFVSIVIPFRNETDHILNTLKSIEDQNYPKDKFEAIFVNDNSDDDSLDKILNKQKSSNIKVLSVPKDFSPNAHKKRAIRFGIENAKGEIIVTTDADCIHKENWLSTLLSYFDDKTGFISGPVEFADNKSFFGKLQRIEFAGLVIVGAGLIGSDNPIICNAANIAYRKSTFLDVNGFNDQLNLSSGDDELLMQKIWKQKKYRVKFCPEKEAIVSTNPNKDLKQFYEQRRRWASKGLFYGDHLLILKLIAIFLFYLGLISTFAAGIFYNHNFLLIFFIGFLLKILSEYLVLSRGQKLLFSKDLLKPFFQAEAFHIPYIIISGIAGTFGNYQWKSRKIKR